MGKIVGRIVEVKGLQVIAKLFTLLPPYLVEKGKRESAPKINGYVKTRIGLETVICQVVGEQSQELNDVVNSHFLSLQVKGYLGKDGFVQGLRILPIVSANIELLDLSDYDLIYNSKTNHTIYLGTDLYDDNKRINVDVNRIIPSHIGVFGNTGSGKSNTLTKILSEYYSLIDMYKTSSGKFLIIDLNNEYGKDSICDNSQKIIYSLSTGKKASSKKIPLDLTSLEEDDFIVLMNASQKTQAPVIKNAYKEMKKGKDERRGAQYYLNFINSILKNGRKSLFFSMRMYLSDYFEGLDNFYFHSQQNKFYYKDGLNRIYSDMDDFDSYVSAIKIQLPDESLDRFLFELYFSVANENENGVNLDFMMPLISRAKKIVDDFRKIFDFENKFTDIFDNKNVCVVQLGNVNKDMKEIVPSIITNNIFNTLITAKEDEDKLKQIINIVVDEAHNILYDDTKKILSHESVLSVFEKVVKEGRKFGLFLMVASQRPSDISPTIISQLHNYFVHKLVNPSDITMIRKAVAYMDDSALDFITILAPGECIVSGTAFQMPAFIHVAQVEKNKRPNSENVVLVGKNGLFKNSEKLD